GIPAETIHATRHARTGPTGGGPALPSGVRRNPARHPRGRARKCDIQPRARMLAHPKSEILLRPHPARGGTSRSPARHRPARARKCDIEPEPGGRNPTSEIRNPLSTHPACFSSVQCGTFSLWNIAFIDWSLDAISPDPLDHDPRDLRLLRGEVLVVPSVHLSPWRGLRSAVQRHSHRD